MDSQSSFEEGKELYKKGHYADSIVAFQSALQTLSDADKQPDKAELLLLLGRSQRMVAKYDDCMETLKESGKLYQQREDKLGYSKVLNQEGLAYDDQYMGTEAAAILNQALAIRHELFAAPHEDLAEIINNLGLVAHKQGNDKEALKCFTEAMEMKAATIGEMHEDFAESLDNRALVLGGLGKLEEAIKGHERALSIREQCLGKNHPELGYSLLNLAHALAQRGGGERVAELQKRTIEIWEKTLGEDSPITAVAINNLGGYYLDKGQLLEAAKYFERALAIKERTLGPDNPGLVKNLNNLAIVYEGLHRRQEAAQLGSRAARLMTQKIEHGSETDVENMILLADQLVAQKRVEEARKIMAQARKVATSQFGPESLKVAHVLKFWADMELQSQPETSKEFLITALRIRKRELGKKDPLVAQTLQSLSACFIMQGDMETSQLLQLQAKVIEVSAGVEDQETAGMVKMLEKLRAQKGDHDPEVLQMIKLVGDLYRMRGDSEKAKEYADEYMQLREAAAGPDNLEFADELVMSAMIMDISRESQEESLSLLHKALAIQERVLGPDSPKLSSTLDTLSTVHERMNNLDLAQEYAERVLALTEKAHGSNHWAVRMPLFRLERLATARGDEASAKTIHARWESLPEPDKIEQSKMLAEQTQRLFASAGAMLQGLSSLFENPVGAGEESLPGDLDLSSLMESLSTQLELEPGDQDDNET